MLRNRFNSVDFSFAKEDVLNFIKDKDSLDIWSKELFISTLDKLR